MDMHRFAVSCLKFLREDEVMTDEPLSRRTTVGCGGKARVLLLPRTPESAAEAYKFILSSKVPHYVLGAGSNTLFLGGFSGAVLCTSRLNLLSVDGEVLEAGAGCRLPRAAARAAASGLSGLEFGEGIPASVGGAVCMNAGAFGQSVGAAAFVTAFDGRKLRRFPTRECGFGYRNSRFLDSGMLVLSAEFYLSRAPREEILLRMADCREKRQASQPPAKGTFGCAFKNPTGDYAGRLIEQCGLKGYAAGGARVSEKHANFIVCEGGSAENIIDLAEHIEMTVWAKCGILLEREFRIAGDTQDVAEVLWRLSHAHEIQPRQGHGGGQCPPRP